MAATITVVPASGNIVHAKTVVRFDIAGLDQNDAGNYDADAYPTQPELRYVLRYTVSAAAVGQSQVFGATPEGKFQVNNYIFPVAGSYTVQVYDVTDPANESAVSDAATVVVS